DGTYDMIAKYHGDSSPDTLFQISSGVSNSNVATVLTPQQSVPEFGYLSGLIVVISTMMIIFVSRLRIL
ncbi:MAG TPA: hypothetical protein VFA69_08505, partial [Candidatus Nitrosotalea sp.]|nr:hypothetical protein [Candidatus Nitrosotalea sp.]